MTVTLKNLHEATAQQVFNQVSHHMLRQGKRCATDHGEGKCAYRAEDADGTMLKCAAGALIADDEYKIEMDEGPGGSGWAQLVTQELVPKAHQALIEDLQDVHDGYEIDQWIRGLETVALKYDLMMSWPVAKDAVIIKHEEEPCF